MPTPHHDTWPDQAETASQEDHLAADLLSAGVGQALRADSRTPVHELVAGFARTVPDRTAVLGADGALSYRSLDAAAAQLAARLRAEGIGRGCRVGILGAPSTTLLAAVLGVLHAGAGYVPIDPSHPDQRLVSILSDAQVSAVVVTSDTEDRSIGQIVPVIHAGHVGAPLSPLTHGTPAPEAPNMPPADSADASDVAYLIYTSGSTGQPKGVVVEHGQLSASTAGRREVYPGSPTFLLLSPLAFDSSMAGLWGTLTAGGTLVVASPDEVRDPEQLVRLVDTHQVTRLLCVPSLYDVFLDAAEHLGLARLRSLETVIVAGESLTVNLIERHFALLTDGVALTNEYGPTEATVWASYCRFTRPEPVSIGGPVPGARLYVLDEQLSPVPRGREGELFIGGAGVARGYYGQPGATESRFLPDPFAGVAGARMYRTGDLVRWNDRDSLEFLGRSDHQIKIRGHRVELGAVEAELCSLPGVREAVVLPDTARTGLIAFVRGPEPAAPQVLRRKLAGRLPAVMIPAQITVLGSFPRTVNGKIDRASLGAQAEQKPARAARSGLPETAQWAGGRPKLAAQVASAWSDVLKHQDIPMDVNFFDLGGHSLAMFQLQEALERHTGHRPSVVGLFRHTTVAAQVALIGNGAGASSGLEDSFREASANRARELRARRQRAQRQEAVR